MARSSSGTAKVLSDRVAKTAFADKGGSVEFERMGNLKLPNPTNFPIPILEALLFQN